jgi:hypothetical protein
MSTIAEELQCWAILFWCMRMMGPDLLLAFPKADRHCHSLFGASLQSIEAWAGRSFKQPPSHGLPASYHGI